MTAYNSNITSTNIPAKMGTYQNGTWQQTTELHEHAMSTLDSSSTTNPENPGEGSCTNIRIPTFIKY